MFGRVVTPTVAQAGLRSSARSAGRQSSARSAVLNTKPAAVPGQKKKSFTKLDRKISAQEKRIEKLKRNVDRWMLAQKKLSKLRSLKLQRRIAALR